MAHNEIVLQRFKHPKFVQKTSATAVGCAGSRVAGALVEIHLDLDDGVIQAGFRAYGCPATVASADWLAEAVDGTPLEQVSPDRQAVAKALSLSASRQHCAALACEALQKALGSLKNSKK